MKILMLNFEYPPIGGGGAYAFYSLLTEYAGREGLVVDVLTSGVEAGLNVEQFADNIKVYKVGIHKKDLHYWRKLEVIEWLFKAGPQYRKMIWENDYDLAHAFFGSPTGYLCWRNAKALPYTILLCGSDVPGIHSRLGLDYKILGPLFKSIWRKSAKVIACSDGLRQRALKFMPDIQIDVVPNGVDIDRFTPGDKKDLGGKIKLIAVGRLSATKRFDVLICAAEILKKKNMDVELVIAGGGALRDQLGELAAQKGLEDVVTFAGRVDGELMPELYRESFVFVSASSQEGMSNAMLEAMASGLPIVTTRCEGVDELIADNGVIVKDNSADSIAGAIEMVVTDSNTYDKMVRAAIERIKLFTWSSAAEKYIEKYKSLIITK